MAAGKRKRGKGRDSGGGGGGGIGGLRSGFRRLVGVEKNAKPTSPFWNVVSWVAVLALCAAAGYMLYRRYGG